MDFGAVITQMVKLVIDNWLPLALTLCLVEVVKMFMPDQYEKKWIPLIAIVIGIGISGLKELGVLDNWIGTGMSVGVLATGGYSLLLDWLSKFTKAIVEMKGEKTNEVPGDPKK